MKIGYLDSEHFSDDEKLLLSKLTDDNPENLINISVDNLEETPELVDIVICFSDRQVLDLPKDRILPPIVVLELAGDHSFFAHFAFNRLEVVVTALFDREFDLDPRELLHMTIDDDAHYLALNDIYILSHRPNTRLRYDLILNESPLLDEIDSANGLLISTPTGSTAMAFNLGGSLIHPRTAAWQVQALAARNHLSRNHIIPSSGELHIEIIDTAFPLFIQVDSERIESECTTIIIQKADHVLNFVKFTTLEPMESLDTKLSQKLSFEDTIDLTSSAKFLLHILQQQDRGLSVNQLMEISHLQNQKTVRNSLNLLISKGFVRRVENLEDLREHKYFFIDQSMMQLKLCLS